MAYSPTKSQFGKSSVSTFSLSRPNLSFSTSQLPPPQLPFQFASSMRQDNSGQFNNHGMGFGTSRMGFGTSRFGTSQARVGVGRSVASSSSRVPANVYSASTFQRDEKYIPDPCAYGFLGRHIPYEEIDEMMENMGFQRPMEDADSEIPQSS